MPNALRSAIDALATDFATAVIEAIRASSLAETLELSSEAPPPRGSGPNPPRATGGVTENAPSDQPEVRGDLAARNLFIAIRGKHHPGLMRAIRWFHSVHGHYPAAADMAAPWPVGSVPIKIPKGPKGSVTKKDYEAIISDIAANPGTTGALAKTALGLEKNRWSFCIARAIKEGKVRKEGELRSTRYWAT
jgi:hypothetical protein